MIELAEMLPPTPSPLWTLARQMGLDYAVGGLPFDDPLNGTCLSGNRADVGKRAGIIECDGVE